jgi:Rrf2 family iron-sulfur cluster assembly transcriptional regulator
MRLTTKGRQAVVAMIDVALHQKAGPVALTGIGRRQKISLSYLEQMFADLRRHGLVVSTRGPGGGYTIARKPETITVADIVFAVDHVNAEPRGARNDLMAVEGQRCLAPELWTSLSQRVVEFLDSIHLQKLVDDHVASGARSLDEVPRRPVAVARPKAVPSLPRAPNSVFQLAKFVTN